MCMSVIINKSVALKRVILVLTVIGFCLGLFSLAGAQFSKKKLPDPAWVKEIEEVFIPSEHCKQCHDRHYEEWKGMREQTPDLKTFGRVDGALLHGTALTSNVFRTVMGLWLQTQPTAQERTRCLACHAPAVTVYPQHTDKIIEQVMAGRKHVQIEGIGCSACHLINAIKTEPNVHPTFSINPTKTLYGSYADPEENLVHPSEQSTLYQGAHYCASCHFSKVRDVTRPDLPGEILKGTVCQDCHMEQSTGSSTSQRGSLTRPIGRHWFQGIVIPGIMLSNRNLQAEWFSRVDIEVDPLDQTVSGKVVIRNGSLPHMFPGGDPVLKQFFVTITAKDTKGKVLATETTQFGLKFEELLRGPIPNPLVNGGMTRRVPFSLSVPDPSQVTLLEASLRYSLIPRPSKELQDKYFATLSSAKEKQTAQKIIEDYASERLLTFRVLKLK